MQNTINLTKNTSAYLKIRELFLAFAEFLSPRHCEVCKCLMANSVNNHEFICDKCYDSIQLAPPPDLLYNQILTKFEDRKLYLTSAYGLLDIKAGNNYLAPIHSLKYNGLKNIGTELGRELGRIINTYNKVEYSTIVPIPIHHARMRERQYNQSELIAIGISEVVNIPVKIDLIKRKRYTHTQTLLSKAERRLNVEDAFSPFNKASKLHGEAVLVVDDVLTTGSTINACAQCLLEIGAGRVDAAAIGIA